MSYTINFIGKIGFAIRELTNLEMSTYCFNASNLTITDPPATIMDDSNSPSNRSFTEEFMLRTYQSGCYYLQSDFSWSSYGLEIIHDSNFTHTHCMSSHLSEFAGGIVVLPNDIDFNYAFANASFDRNSLIYSLIIAFFVIYVLVGIWCFYMDRMDRKKTRINILKDNKMDEEYYYEIMVFTGNRRNAQTDSNVSFILYGNDDETEIRKLESVESNRKHFRRGAIDSFIMSVNRSLGDLTYLKVWHDNAGKGINADWYLKCVIVHDLQTREKFYFIGQRWLSLDQDGDCKLDALLPVAGDMQKQEYKYMLEKQTKQNMSDGHLWFSVVARPVQSGFDRLERWTCCIVLLFLAMLVNILYYDVDKSSNADALKIGPFSLTIQQISIGIMCNLIVFPPSFLLVFLFRRSRPRVGKSRKLRKICDKLNQERDRFKMIHKIAPKKIYRLRYQELYVSVAKSNRLNKMFSLPWWFKSVAYMFAFACVGTCVFFIIIKGITFGQEKVAKWLTSLLVSILSSILLTQPIQIVLTTLLFITVCRSTSDNKDFECDYDDNGKSLNQKYTYFDDENENKKKNDEDVGNLQDMRRKLMDVKEDTSVSERRKLNLKLRKLTLELLLNLIFLTFLFAFSYTSKDLNSYWYSQQLKRSFIDYSGDGLVGFSEITTPLDFWKWSTNTFTSSFQKSNNGKFDYLIDNCSFLVANLTFRQLRIKNGNLMNRLKTINVIFYLFIYLNF